MFEYVCSSYNLPIELGPAFLILRDEDRYHIFVSIDALKVCWDSGYFPNEDRLTNFIYDELMRNKLYLRSNPISNSPNFINEPEQWKTSQCVWDTGWTTVEPIIKNLKTSFLILPSTIDIDYTPLLKRIPPHKTYTENYRHNRLPVNTILILDDTAEKIDTRLLTIKNLPDVLKLREEDYLSWFDMGPSIERNRWVKRAQKDPTILLPRSAIYWRCVISKQRYVPAAWIIYIIKDADIYGNQFLPINTMTDYFPDGPFPLLQQWKHIVDMSYRPNFPINVHIRINICRYLTNETERFGIIDGSRTKYNLKHARFGKFLHPQLVPLCFDGFALQQAMNIKECPICDERADTIIDCGHMYCMNCISKINICAICREPITDYTSIIETIIPTIPEPSLKKCLRKFLKPSLIIVPSSIHKSILREWGIESYLKTDKWPEYIDVICTTGEIDHTFFQKVAKPGLVYHRLAHLEAPEDINSKKLCVAYGCSESSCYLN